MDLLLRQNGRNLGFEFKLTRAPKVTSSMRSSQEALGLDRLYVVCHGAGEPWPLAEGIIALPALFWHQRPGRRELGLKSNLTDSATEWRD
jgi:hypothetical protein